MPELPEVETVVRMLQKEGVQREVIEKVRLSDPRCVSGMNPALFCRKMTDRQITQITRRGKYIVIRLDQDETLLMHLRMTGRVLFGDKPDGSHIRASFLLSDGRWLQFFDTRRFGDIRLTSHPEEKLDKLGPEPLDSSFTAARLGEIFGKTGRAVKAVLLDQQRIAGLGNIYCDEALWEAGIHPERPADSLSRADIQKLHKAVKKVLRKGIRNFGTTLGHGLTNFQLPGGNTGQNREKLNVYGRTGGACPRCNHPVVRIKVAQRGTHFCPECQKKQP